MKGWSNYILSNFMINLEISKLFNTTLVFFLLIFFGSLIIIDGYPHNNDILYIFKISSLEGNFKFINGLYGPGYTYFTLIFFRLTPDGFITNKLSLIL